MKRGNAKLIQPYGRSSEYGTSKVRKVVKRQQSKRRRAALKKDT